MPFVWHSVANLEAIRLAQRFFSWCSDSCLRLKPRETRSTDPTFPTVFYLPFSSYRVSKQASQFLDALSLVGSHFCNAIQKQSRNVYTTGTKGKQLFLS